MLLGRGAALKGSASGFTLLNHQIASVFGGTATLSNFDATGANLIVIAITAFTLSTVSDSKGNTYTNAVNIGFGGGGCGIYYCAAPDVSALLDFTLTDNSVCFEVFAFSGCNTSDALEATNSNGYNITTPGSCTATLNGSVFLFAYNAGFTDVSAATIDSGFTLTTQGNSIGGHRYATVFGYKIQSTAGSENPALSVSASDACMAVFNPA